MKLAGFCRWPRSPISIQPKILLLRSPQFWPRALPQNIENQQKYFGQFGPHIEPMLEPMLIPKQRITPLKPYQYK